MRALLLLLLLPAISFASIGRKSDRFMLNYLQWGPKFELGYESLQQVYYGTKTDVVKRNKVQTVKSFTINKHGRKTSWYERTFDASGRLVRMKSKNNVVDFKFTDTLLTEIQRTSKKDKFNTKIAYDSQARIVKITFYKNEKITAESNYVYFSENKTSLVERKVYGKKMKTYRLETDYDKLLKKASESRYLVNGELKKRWTYSCDEKGKLQETKIEEVTQCNYFASNSDGSYISYTRTLEDEKDVLQESTYSKDSVLIDYKKFLKDTILMVHWWNADGNKTVSENYKKNGKRTHKFIQEKDKNGNIIRYANYGKKDKKENVTTLMYSEDGLIREVTYETGQKVQFEYTYL